MHSIQGPSYQPNEANCFRFHERQISSGAHGTLHRAIFDMSGLAVEVQGKYIGFIGDRGNGRYPVPFLLPPQNAWAWAKVKYLDDTVAFEEHFEDAAVWDKLWIMGAAETALKETLLPRLLALPTFVRKTSVLYERMIHSSWGRRCLAKHRKPWSNCVLAGPQHTYRTFT